MIKELILYSDFLGVSPSLYFKKRKKFATLFTGILSLLVITTSIGCVGYFGKDLFYKTKPSVTVSREVFSDFSAYEVNNKEFMFVISLEYKNNSAYIDPTIYEITAENLLMSNGTFLARNKLEVDVCSNIYKQEDIIEQNMKIPLERFYCIKPNQTNIRGYWGSENYSTIKINVNKCENRTENNYTCRPRDEIDELIQDGYISFEFTSYEIDQINYENPFKRVFYDIFNILNVNASINYNINLSPDNFRSDNGLVFDDYKEYAGYNPEILIFNSFKQSSTVASVRIEGNSLGRVLNRNYIKLQNILTQIGGFVKAIIMIANFCSFYFSSTFYFVFNLHSLDEKKQITNINESSIINFNPMLISSKSFQTLTPKLNFKKQLEDLKNYKEFKFTRVQTLQKYKNVFSRNTILNDFFKYIKYKILFKHDNKILRHLKRFENIYKKCLSVEVILEKLFEAEMVKEKVFENKNIKGFYKNCVKDTILNEKFISHGNKIFCKSSLVKSGES